MRKSLTSIRNSTTIKWNKFYHVRWYGIWNVFTDIDNFIVRCSNDWLYYFGLEVWTWWRSNLAFRFGHFATMCHFGRNWVGAFCCMEKYCHVEHLHFGNVFYFWIYLAVHRGKVLWRSCLHFFCISFNTTSIDAFNKKTLYTY